MSGPPIAAPPEPGDAAPPRLAPIPREHITIYETYTRPPQDRPTHAIVDDIVEGLAEPARQLGSGVDIFDLFAWNLVAAGMPLLRVTLHVGMIHPQFLGTTISGGATPRRRCR